MWNHILFACQLITIFSFVLICLISLASALFNKISIDKTAKPLFINISIFLIFYIISSLLDSYLKPPKPDISSRIESVSTSLTEISTEIEEIQSELTQRIELVAELKKEAEIAENFISLSDDQVSAIQAKLKQEFESNSGKSLLQGILINAFFFVIGIISPRIIELLKKKLNKTNKANSTSSTNSYSEEEISQAVKLLDAIKKDKK